MKFCAVILARGGSKGIPNKNIIDFCGKPLLAWTIEHCRDSGIDSIYVSSDSDKILEVGEEYGALSIKRSDIISGDNATSESGWLHALEIIEDKTKKNGLDVFNKALENVSPVVEVKSKRIGGATYQVPIEVRYNRRSALAMRWIISYSKGRKGKTMADRLSAEILAASENDGSSVKKKEDTHKMAEANKAFSHFR